jgi:cell division protein FtsA
VELRVNIRSNTDYISRSNPQEVIGGDDIQLLIDQVNKLAMLPGEEIIHVYLKNLKLMVNLKSKSL